MASVGSERKAEHKIRVTLQGLEWLAALQFAETDNSVLRLPRATALAVARERQAPDKA